MYGKTDCIPRNVEQSCNMHSDHLAIQFLLNGTLMIFLVWCLFSPGTCDDAKSSAVADLDNIFNQIRSGKKFSEIVDLESFLNDFPQARELVEFLDEIEFFEESCYSEVVRNLNIDCREVSDPREIALRFTECFYQASNRPSNISKFSTVEEATHKDNMNSECYAVYTTMKAHWLNLCLFAKQALFNAATSRQLLGLFQSVANSSDVMKSMNYTLNNASSAFDQSIDNLEHKVDAGNRFLDEIDANFTIFNMSLSETITSILKPLSHIDNVRSVLLVCIIAFLVGLFLPEVLLPGLAVYIAFNAIDFFMRRKTENWAESAVRTCVKWTFILVLAVYPGYRVYTWARSAAPRAVCAKGALVIPQTVRRKKKSSRGPKAF